MHAQGRLVNRSTRPMAFGILVAVALAVALFAGVLHHPQASISTPPQAAISHQQAPDALDRNDAYSKALSARFANLSPDAQERNVQLSGR